MRNNKEIYILLINTVIKRMSVKPKVNKSGQKKAGHLEDLTEKKADHLKDLTDKFINLSKQCIEKGLSFDETRDIALRKSPTINGHVKSKFSGKGFKSWTFRTKLCVAVLVLGVATAGLAYALDIRSVDDLMATIRMEDHNCILYNNGALLEVARPLVNCGICRNLHQVPIERGISVEDFKRKYAYSGVPVLIKDATADWSAMSTFDFNYFKDLYTGTEGALESVEEECQFFPYKTEFDTLAEVFNMTDDRANFKDGEKPWYIGWSNCHGEVKSELRKHYQRPFFLPNDSESSTIDWMFMGGSGLGAFIHLDYVERPSWQAQISGKKTWTLLPSPECEAECSEMNVTVHKGDIFVIDTNVWYHATYIHPGEISITIGSEYD